MGADSLANAISCTKTTELIETAMLEKLTLPSVTDLQQEIVRLDSTLDARQFQKALSSCSDLARDEEVDKKLKEIGSHTPILPSDIGTDFNFKREIVWKNVVGFALLHICGWIGLHLAFWWYCDWRTTVYSKYGRVCVPHGTYNT